jgi:hypothetical protein
MVSSLKATCQRSELHTPSAVRWSESGLESAKSEHSKWVSFIEAARQFCWHGLSCIYPELTLVGKLGSSISFGTDVGFDLIKDALPLLSYDDLLRVEEESPVSLISL